jgi:integrase
MILANQEGKAVMLTLVKNRHFTKVIGRKRFYWPLGVFTKQEAELEAAHLSADWARFRLEGHQEWPENPTYRLALQARLGIGPFRQLPTSIQAKSQGVHPNAPTPLPIPPGGALAIGPHLTFSELCGVFLSEQTAMNDKKKRDLRNRLRFVVNDFSSIAVGRMDRSTLLQAAKTINEADKSVYYKRDIHQALYRLFYWASQREKLGFIAPANLKEIFTPVKSAKTANEVWDNEEGKYWKDEEVKLALSKAQGELKAFVILGLNCGYSTSEIGALKKEHLVDISGAKYIRTIRNKTAKNQKPAKLRHKLWPETIAAIQETMSKDPELVFTTSKGNDVATNDYVGKLYREFLEEHKLELPQFKALRKTSANAVKALSDSDIASLHLGHATKTVTEAFYTEANWSKLDKATDTMRSKWVTASI